MFTAISGLSVSFALFWLVFGGVWVILPFTLMELSFVAAAFWWIERSSEDRDRLEVSDHGLSVTCIRRGKSQKFIFSRNWLTIENVAQLRGAPTGIRLRQSGQSVAMLEFLSGPELALALHELRNALSLR